MLQFRTIVLFTVLSWSARGLAQQVPAGAEGGVAVYFSPETDCRALVIEQIQQANKEILVQAYSFTSEKIAKALVAAHKRGVRVTVILDAEKADKKSETNFLAKRGIETFIDSSHEKAHSKVILLDGRVILTGSFNLADDDNKDPRDKADNVVLMQDKPTLMAAYRKSFEQHLSHSKKY